MKAIERLNEFGLASGDFSPTFEAADMRSWCNENNFDSGIAEVAIRQCIEATDMARDETATMFWPTVETIASVIESAQAQLAESAEWPPKPAPLPEVTEALPREKRRAKKGQLLINKEGVLE